MPRIEEFDDVQLDVEFEQATSRSNLTSNENIAILFGKISKWYEALVPTGGSSGQFLAWNSSGTAKWVANPNVDTKVTSTLLAQSTAAATYLPTFVSAAGNSGVNIMNSFSFGHTVGTTSAVGNSRIVLGNATASGTANNEEGQIILYSSSTSYHTIKGNATASTVTHSLPTTGGTILNTGTTSFTQTLASGTKIGSIKINGTSTDIYAPTNTNTTYTLTQDATDGHKITLTPSSGTAQTVTIPDNNTTYTLSGAYGSSSNTWVTTLTPSSGTATTSTVPTASTSVYGITKLSSSTNSTSTALAATPSAVKSAYDLANGKSTVSFSASLTTGTKVGTITIDGSATDIYCETNTNTDTKVTDTVGTANTYYPAGGTSTSTATGTQVFDTSLKFIGTTGTTSAVGKAQLVLGNSTASGTANNKQGSIVVYGSTAYAHTIQGAPTAARTLTLPNKTGTVAVTSDIPTVNDATLTLKGAGTTVTTFTANASSAKSLDIVAGSNVTVTADATNAKISIASSHPTITKSTDTTSTASPAHGGTFTTVDSVTRDGNGHVTKINTKTVTLPADSNTTYTLGTSGNNVILTPSSGSVQSITVPYASNAAASNSLKITGYGNSNLTFYQAADDFGGTEGRKGNADDNYWSHYIIANHGNGETYYHYTIRLPFWGSPQYQRKTGGSDATAGRTKWLDFITEENYTSYTVTKTGGGASGSWGISVTGTSSNVTGTVAIANGGTGATTRLDALKALTNENVGTSATYFLTITTSWGKGGYTSVADARTVLGLKSAAYTESSDYVPNTKEGVSDAINLLTTGTTAPNINDYYIAQYVNGGTTYHRRPISLLWNTFKELITLTTTGSGNAVTAVSIANDGDHNRKITVTKGSTFSLSTHTHGLLHSNLSQVATNGTTGGWSAIGIDPAVTGYVLKSIRVNRPSPNWLSGDYCAGIAFGGFDTKGVISMRYNSPVITFAGGNHNSTNTGPDWYIKISGTSGKTYNFDNCMGAVKIGDYYGMADPDGTDISWTRTSSKGIIPYAINTDATYGNTSSLGTSTWTFVNGYINNLYYKDLKTVAVVAGGTADNGIDKMAGSFFFSGNYLFGGVYDWVGIQAGYGSDKFQLIANGIDGVLYRHNDAGGTNTTNWTEIKNLMTPEAVSGQNGITVTKRTNTFGTGDAALTFDVGVNIGHSNSVTAETTFNKSRFKYDAQGHITSSSYYVHTAIGSNTNGWIKIATMKHIMTYDNTPIMLTISQRYSIIYRLHIHFAAANSTDPDLKEFQLVSDEDTSARAYMIKSATSTWDLYIKKLNPYDAIVVTEFDVGYYFTDHMTWAWTDVQTADSAITGGTEATKKVYSTTDHTHNYAGSSSAGGPALSVSTAGGDVVLGTPSSSSDDSGDIVWTYGNGQEKARLRQNDTYTAKVGPIYRIYKSDGTSLYSGRLPLADGTSAFGTWGISITGNAATSSAWATARTLTLSGQLTGSVSVKGNANMTLNGYLDRAFIYDDNAVSSGHTWAEYAWHKFAEVTITTSFTDLVITFLVSRTYNGSAENTGTGILSARLRTNGSKAYDVAELKWLVRNSDLSKDDFVMVYTSTSGTSTKAELWCRLPNRYHGLIFTVLKEHARQYSTDTSWTLVKTPDGTGSTHGSSSYPTTGITGTIISSDGTITNSTTGIAASANKLNTDAGGTYLPVYFSSGVPTAVTVKNNTSVGTIGWTSGAATNAALVTVNSIAYWNGAYNGTSSNLTYCNRGAFGTIVTKSTTDYSKVSITRNLTSGTKVGTITIDGTATDLYCQTNTTSANQTDTTTNADYRVLFSTNANDTTQSGTTRKNINLQYNPSTATLKIGDYVSGSTATKTGKLVFGNSSNVYTHTINTNADKLSNVSLTLNSTDGIMGTDTLCYKGYEGANLASDTEPGSLANISSLSNTVSFSGYLARFSYFTVLLCVGTDVSARTTVQVSAVNGYQSYQLIWGGAPNHSGGNLSITSGLVNITESSGTITLNFGKCASYWQFSSSSSTPTKGTTPNIHVLKVYGHSIRSNGYH